MTDVRLTATNPEDSSVVPVACNAKGELLLEDVPAFDGNVDGDLTVSGSVVIGKPFSVLNSYRGVRIESVGSYNYLISNDVQSGGGTATCYQHLLNGSQTLALNADGSAEFAGGDIEFFVGGAAVYKGAINVYREAETNAGLIIGLNGDNKTILTADGSAEFASGSVAVNLTSNRARLCVGRTSSGKAFAVENSSTNSESVLFMGDGSAEFAGDVTVGSRNKRWMLVEQGGLCHMVEQLTASTADLGEPVLAAAEYPPLRDVFSELNAIETALGEVMEKLRMKPPAGWEVWDGSSENS